MAVPDCGGMMGIADLSIRGVLTFGPPIVRSAKISREVSARRVAFAVPRRGERQLRAGAQNVEVLSERQLSPSCQSGPQSGLEARRTQSGFQPGTGGQPGLIRCSSSPGKSPKLACDIDIDPTVESVSGPIVTSVLLGEATRLQAYSVVGRRERVWSRAWGHFSSEKPRQLEPRRGNIRAHPTPENRPDLKFTPAGLLVVNGRRRRRCRAKAFSEEYQAAMSLGHSEPPPRHARERSKAAEQAIFLHLA